MRFLKSKEGLSLIELLVGMALMGLLLAAVVPLLSTMVTITTKGMSNNDLMEEARWTMTVIAQDLSGGTLPNPGQAQITNSLIFQRWDTGWNIATNAGTPISYSIPLDANKVTTNQVCRQVGSGTPYPLTDSNRVLATGLSFTTSANAENVTITLTLANPNNPAQSETVSSTVFFLNNQGKYGEQ